MGETAWAGTRGAIGYLLRPSQRNDWFNIQYVDLQDGVLTLSCRTKFHDEVKRHKSAIINEMKKRAATVTFVDVIAPPPVRVLEIAPPLPEQGEIIPAPTPPTESCIEALERRLAEAERRADYYETLATQNAATQTTGGLNFAFLLPYLPQLPNATAKAILTLLALGGVVHMTAREFAENMGWKPDGVTYKRMFAGADDLVNIAGKNVDMPSISQIKIDTLSISGDMPSNDKLIPRQFPESEKLIPYQLLPAEIDTLSTFTPPHDMNECISKNISSDMESSFMRQAAQREILRFAADQLDFNPQFPPERLAECDPIKAMALVLQAKHHKNATNPPGMWRDMINRKQRPAKKWVEVAYEYLELYHVAEAS